MGEFIQLVRPPIHGPLVADADWFSWVGGTAGAGGGLVASIATCPLDVVKTKLQAQRAIQGQLGYLGVLGAFLVLLILRIT